MTTTSLLHHFSATPSLQAQAERDGTAVGVEAFDRRHLGDRRTERLQPLESEALHSHALLEALQRDAAAGTGGWVSRWARGSAGGCVGQQ
eukprot:5739-Chlamydomonas_euryale.AAC.1